MRAVVCTALGEPEGLTLESLPSAPVGPGQVRIHVHAAGVNFADGLLVAGTYQEKPPLPFTPGFEVAGVVAELGPEVVDLAVGDRVLGLVGVGGYADEVVADAVSVYKIPDMMSFEAAAGFPIAYGTSHGALDWRADLKPGETLLVLGAAGGVGLTAVEIGHAMGATVIAAASSPEKLAIAQSRGADHLIDTSSEDVRTRVKELTQGRGVNVVYDPVGGELFDAALRSIAWEGRLVVIGFAGGKVPQIPANLLLVKNCSAVGFYWGSYRAKDPARVRASFAALLGWVADGTLKPHISETFPLEAAAKAIRVLQSRKATGKVVLTTGR
ncbi:NADPH:quinone oxidoreductase [Aliidongia dinghuensis]|uniref:NADPH:quinone oxidoreductase n=1 Tax=Aliidongia dinghuensis TaxID=1867774 RepID=A0A8J3E1V6_9PROT|nr:NADPH:quinone oxidoreductase family protein [Aliidongia dinghuensis]GGF02935.1 NADPH:quinone oxidoreductase [Aliidongia dinghuensis]